MSCLKFFHRIQLQQRLQSIVDIEIDIAKWTYNEDDQCYRYNCRCGDLYEVLAGVIWNQRNNLFVDMFSETYIRRINTRHTRYVDSLMHGWGKSDCQSANLACFCTWSFHDPAPPDVQIWQDEMTDGYDIAPCGSCSEQARILFDTLPVRPET